MKISEILHIAADKYLWDGTDRNLSGRDYSCNAIFDACFNCNFDFDIVKKGLQEMGFGSDSYCEFEEFKTPEERQAARYLWLKWAALMAEEQGV